MTRNLKLSLKWSKIELPLFLKLSALQSLRICRFLGSDPTVLSATGRTLGITRSLKPLPVFRDVFLAHQRHKAWETYHGNRWCSYRKTGLWRKCMKIIITGFFTVNLAYVGMVPIHTHSAVASSSCLVKSSKHQMMTLQLHCGQGSSVL